MLALRTSNACANNFVSFGAFDILSRIESSSLSAPFILSSTSEKEEPFIDPRILANESTEPAEASMSLDTDFVAFSISFSTLFVLFLRNLRPFAMLSLFSFRNHLNPCQDSPYLSLLHIRLYHLPTKITSLFSAPSPPLPLRFCGSPPLFVCAVLLP